MSSELLSFFLLAHFALVQFMTLKKLKGGRKGRTMRERERGGGGGVRSEEGRVEGWEWDGMQLGEIKQIWRWGKRLKEGKEEVKTGENNEDEEKGTKDPGDLHPP